MLNTLKNNNYDIYRGDLHGRVTWPTFCIISTKYPGQILVETRCREILLKGYWNLRLKRLFESPRYLCLNDTKFYFAISDDMTADADWRGKFDKLCDKLGIKKSRFYYSSENKHWAAFPSKFWLQSPPLFSAFFEIVRSFMIRGETPSYVEQIPTEGWSGDNWIYPGTMTYIDTNYFYPGNQKFCSFYCNSDYQQKVKSWPALKN